MGSPPAPAPPSPRLVPPLPLALVQVPAATPPPPPKNPQKTPSNDAMDSGGKPPFPLWFCIEIFHDFFLLLPYTEIQASTLLFFWTLKISQSLLSKFDGTHCQGWHIFAVYLADAHQEVDKVACGVGLSVLLAGGIAHSDVVHTLYSQLWTR